MRQVQILSFRHTKISERNCLGSPHPLRGPRPPTGNPGSANAIFNPMCDLFGQNIKETSVL